MLACNTSALGLTPEEAEALKPVKVLVVTQDTIPMLWDLLLGKRNDTVIDLRIGPRFLTTELQVRVRKWVDAGGGILVYGGVDDTNDSAAIFFPKMEYTDLRRWRAVIARVPQDAKVPVVNQVSEVKIFMRRLPKPESIKGTGGVVILAISDTQPVAFVMNYGKGRLAYLPTGTLFPAYPVDEYDNKRLFLNLFRWLGKEPVPK
jgi:hypothetical protein